MDDPEAVERARRSALALKEEVRAQQLAYATVQYTLKGNDIK
jgi:hypothetical protein